MMIQGRLDFRADWLDSVAIRWGTIRFGAFHIERVWCNDCCRCHFTNYNMNELSIVNAAFPADVTHKAHKMYFANQLCLICVHLVLQVPVRPDVQSGAREHQHHWHARNPLRSQAESEPRWEIWQRKWRIIILITHGFVCFKLGIEFQTRVVNSVQFRSIEVVMNIFFQ